MHELVPKGEEFRYAAEPQHTNQCCVDPHRLAEKLALVEIEVALVLPPLSAKIDKTCAQCDDTA